MIINPHSGILKKIVLFCCALWLSFFAISGCSRHAPPISKEPGKPKPYRVGKTWYQPVSSAKGFKQKGVASWYGKKFHGRKTSNGETYDMYAMTAAHKTLPHGTHVRVTNLDNDKSVTVRINDRGPFVHGRIIDLSYTAAKKIDIVASGTGPVEIVAIGHDGSSGKASSKKSKKAPVDYYTGNFTFQLGAFREKNNAIRFRNRLDKTYKNAHVTEYDTGQGIMYRVRVGRASTLAKAEEYEKTLIQHGFKDVFIVAE